MTAPSTFRPKSDLLSVLVERGYLHQCTDLERLDARAATGVVTGYIGFDATASSLHVGSLLVIMLLRRMQQTGHKPIVVMGGGTTKVGDPSGKDTQRVMLDDAGIAANIASLKRAFEPFLTFGAGPSEALMVDNDSWLSTFGYVEFLREYGPHFTINRMLTFDSVKLRLEREQPLSFLEFNYMLMQAVDFLELSRRHACDLQLGGSDQWGNIVNGVELIRRKDAREAFGFTAPLITTSSGVKMGKTADGAVWLNADLRSPYDYWQFWRNTEDADVGRFLKLFTDLPLDEIARLETLQGAEINEAKKVLADAATAMLHGAAGLATARSTTSGATLAGLESFDLHWDGGEGWTARHASALIVAAKLAPSLKQARQRIEQGVRINDHLIKSDDALTLDQQLEGGGGFKVQVGKRIVLVRPV